ncbi:MAG: hypothetical protein WAQ53_07495 [Thiofilum sp.]|uniref:hypothetical protein n=1 Tax=Thiofilum sp. TaxID=2212733 RepID=UPI0025E872D3|nr:hypothetical protein [Thiofilum sp.]MBK8453430.1 hypothetical protein [Thiofilum sp.]
MFRYGIKALEVKQGYKSYLAIKNLGKLSINEVKDGVTKGDILGIWEFKERDLNKLKLWQAKMQTEMRGLFDSGVTYDSYVHHDELGWQPITQLEPLLHKDQQTLQFVIERDQQAFAALQRYQQNDNPSQALDELITLMPDEMREVLYDAGASPSFNARLNRMLPSLDSAETRMLAYELDSHVRRQSINLGTAGLFGHSTPEPTAPHVAPPQGVPLETEYQVIEEIPVADLKPEAADISVSSNANVATADLAMSHSVASDNNPPATKLKAATIAPPPLVNEQAAQPLNTSATTVLEEDLPATPWWLLGVIALLLGLVWWLG